MSGGFLFKNFSYFCSPMKKLLFVLLILGIYACGSEEKSAGKISQVSSQETVPIDTLQKVEKFFTIRHKILKQKYDTLLYVYTPSVLTQPELMRLTESPTQYKIYKRFEEHFNEIIDKHGEVLLEFKKWKEQAQKQGGGNPSEAGKFLKMEKIYFDKYFKLQKQYKNWINDHKQGKKSLS